MSSLKQQTDERNLLFRAVRNFGRCGEIIHQWSTKRGNWALAAKHQGTISARWTLASGWPVPRPVRGGR